MKKMSFIFALMFSGLLAVSCGSDDDNNGSVVDRQDREEAVGKNLFSVWRDTSDTALTLDFRDYTFNEEAPFFFRTSQAILCSCSIEFNGSQRSGDILLSDCTGIDACLDVIDTYSYEKSENTLIICDSRRSCDTFE